MLAALILLLPWTAPPHAARRKAVAAPAPAPTLEGRLAAVLNRAALRGAQLGAAVAALPDGRRVFDRQPLAPLAPASTMKVLTTAATLDRLGPDFRFQTLFLAGGPIRDGVLDGNLYVRGQGAPDLVVEQWYEIAAQLAGLGIGEIRGDIVGDDTYFDSERRAPGWPPAFNASPYNAPISALSANFNTVQVSVLPTKVGQKPMVLIEPRSDFVRAENRARTGRGTSLRVSRRYDGQANTVSVAGTIGARSGMRMEWLGVENPSQAAVAALKATLQDSGVAVRGSAVVSVAVPDANLIYSHPSKPLAEIVADANKNSNNFITECLQRTLGAVEEGPPGSREKGAKAVEKFLASAGAPVAGLHLVDGCGLSRDNRLTSGALLAVLLHMAADPRVGAPFMASLSVGGVDGTLRHRFLTEPGRVLGKTGTINSSRGLVGYVLDASGRPAYAFSILINDYRCSESAVLDAIDDFARALVEAAGSAAS